MIDNKTFLTELRCILQRQGMNKKDIEYTLDCAEHEPKEKWNDILEEELMIANQKEANTKQQQKTRSEKIEQELFVEWWRQTYPSHLVSIIRNDGSRTPREKVEQIALGLHPGASDLYIPIIRCWLEMKKTKNWNWPEDQKKFAEYVESIGDHYILGIGFEDAKNKVLEIIQTKKFNHEREMQLEIIR